MGEHHDFRIGVAWSTYFQRPLVQRMQDRRLRYAYRAPSLFLQGMLAAGADIEMIDFDENLDGSDLAPGSPAQQLDILYVATHGMTSRSGFGLGLHGADWALLSGGFGDDRSSWCSTAALGDDDADARHQLDNLTLGAFPGPRSSAVPGIAWWA